MVVVGGFCCLGLCCDLLIWLFGGYLLGCGDTGSLCVISCWFPAVLPLFLDLVVSWLL